jgi:O-acetyl-ADP-ribose deacetylase (regulator of RNase III)
MPITRIYNGNLFDSTTQCKVNTVNTVGAMGAGIALQFKFIYPAMYDSYRDYCKKGEFKVGMLQVWKQKDNDWVLNFPTKKRWKDKSEIEYLEKGLQNFVNTYKKRGITSITFPQLGTANGGLNWEKDVKPLMEYYLNQVDIPVEIVLYQPKRC